MTTWVIIGLIVAAAILFLAVRGRGSKDNKAAAPPVEPRANIRTASGADRAKDKTSTGAPRSRFRGEVFAVGETYCTAAEALKNRTFKRGSNTEIPRPGCDMRDTCTCHLREIEERRRGERRINADRRGDIRFADDRRSGRDRREGADAWKLDV